MGEVEIRNYGFWGKEAQSMNNFEEVAEFKVKTTIFQLHASLSHSGGRGCAQEQHSRRGMNHAGVSTVVPAIPRLQLIPATSAVWSNLENLTLHTLAACSALLQAQRWP